MVEELELLGFYDIDQKNAAKVSSDLEVTSWENVEALMDAVDIVDIVTPTLTHYELALKAIQKGKWEAYIGGKETSGIWLKRFFPKLLHRVVLRSQVV